MSSFPPPEYGGPGQGGWTWAPGANQRFIQENSFDPVTGAPRGPVALPPADVALQWQAEHDRRVWDYRQRLMRSASNFGRGGLGLLQSFRQGGSAAIEAGQYNTLAGIEMQRASMTQPLDLLGDYRRHEMAMNRQAANRQQERQIGIQSAALIAQLVVGNYGGALASLGGVVGSALGIGQQPLATPGMQPRQPGTQPAGVQHPGGGTGPVPSYGIGQPGQLPQDKNFIGPPEAPTGQPLQSQGSGEQAPQPMKQVAPPGEQGQPQPGQGGQDTPGSIPGGGMGAVGTDGNFTPVAYAANSALQSAQDPIQQLALGRSLAFALDEDPVWDALSFAIDKRMAERFAA